jgi:hypothetical protein
MPISRPFSGRRTTLSSRATSATPTRSSGFRCARSARVTPRWRSQRHLWLRHRPPCLPSQRPHLHRLRDRHRHHRHREGARGQISCCRQVRYRRGDGGAAPPSLLRRSIPLGAPSIDGQRAAETMSSTLTKARG